MKKLKKMPTLLLLTLAMIGNASVCIGKELQFDSFRVDSIPKSDKGIVNPAMAWMYVQEKLDGTCHLAQDEILRIHYEEPYAVSNHQRLRFRILDKYRSVILETSEMGVVDNAGCTDTLSPGIKTGENWLTIDLSCLSLAEDYYYLEVWNGKGEVSYLRFKCNPANQSSQPSKRR